MTALARSTDPDTSHLAAASLEGSSLDELVLKVVREAGEHGATLDDLEDAIPGVRVVSLSPRPARLEEKGLVYDTGERRKGRAGRLQRVLRYGFRLKNGPQETRAEAAIRTLRGLGYRYINGEWSKA